MAITSQYSCQFLLFPQIIFEFLKFFKVVLFYAFRLLFFKILITTRH